MNLRTSALASTDVPGTPSAHRAQWVTTLRRLDVHAPVLRWVRSLPLDTTAAGAWSQCSRGDWLASVLGDLHRHGALPRAALVIAACAAARTVMERLLGLPAEAAAVAAIETAERWCRGEATRAEVRAARDAAWRAASTSDNYAAAYTAFAAVDAACTASNGHASADAFACAASRGSETRRAEIADAVRAVVPWPVVEAALARLSAPARVYDDGARLAAGFETGDGGLYC